MASLKALSRTGEGPLMGTLPPLLVPSWSLPPMHLSSRTFRAISAWVRQPPDGSPRYLMDSSRGYNAVPQPPITMYW
jgi:hypothetical protein